VAIQSLHRIPEVLLQNDPAIGIEAQMAEADRGTRARSTEDRKRRFHGPTQIQIAAIRQFLFDLHVDTSAAIVHTSQMRNPLIGRIERGQRVAEIELWRLKRARACFIARLIDAFIERGESIGRIRRWRRGGGGLQGMTVRFRIVRRSRARTAGERAKYRDPEATSIHNLTLRNRNAFAITLMELAPIAAAAMIGDNNSPNSG